MAADCYGYHCATLEPWAQQARQDDAHERKRAAKLDEQPRRPDQNQALGEPDFGYKFLFHKDRRFSWVTSRGAENDDGRLDRLLTRDCLSDAGKLSAKRQETPS